ncbi:MBL fold metallo-hydrolase [Paramicrobacterium humi]|uniref:MBL fold metallo-hydrolase n=1 Tax=Paramicrobacterium humi TaxID=640635 RepID=UPI002481F42C|nr:MBL fold metallo-hydrolase [Microbacterium humi]
MNKWVGRTQRRQCEELVHGASWVGGSRDQRGPHRRHHGSRSTLYETAPDAAIANGDEYAVAGVQLRAVHTPGHSPGSTCFVAPSLNAVFTGDTLFQGGPGATGGSYSDFPTIIESIRTHLLTLPEETVVYTGHGDTTTIGAEKPHLEEWIARGH